MADHDDFDFGSMDFGDYSDYGSLYEDSNYPSRSAPTHREAPPPSRRKKKKRKKGHPIISGFFKTLGTLLLVGLCTGTVLLCFAVVYIRTVIFPIADLSMDDMVFGSNSTMLYMNPDTGNYEELVTLASATTSTWVNYDEIPQYLKDAAVAIEDQRFWEHSGVDWKRTGKAVLDMFRGGDISGGSTITQQLIKNMTNYNETTVKRKVTEIVRALRFTQNNSKEDTLLWYLNIIPLGSGCKGVGAAALEYFGKPVSELTLAECASLIGITNNPSKYGPYSGARVATSTGEIWTSRQWNKWRQELVLSEMKRQGKISEQEYNEAVAQELVFVKAEEVEAQESTVYSWYEETVLSDVREDLKTRLGWSDERVTQAMEQGGLRIYTCLNPRLQEIAEKIYADRSNLNYTSKSGQQMQSSITILDNSDGSVAAIVGQFGGNKTGNLWNNYANSGQRQPGSSFKPLSVYSPAIELGYLSPISVVDDYPYQVMNGKAWPTNSGAARYQGLSTVLRGITDSVNTMAVRIINDYVTPEASFDFVQNRYHIDLVEAMEVGGEMHSDIDTSPLAMGGLTLGVCTRDMAEGFATFPNRGMYTYSRTYTKITQMVGDEEILLLDNPIQQEAILKETTAYYMNTMLQNVIKAGTAEGYSLRNMHCAGKTGTTNNQFDRWFVGYTPYYTAAVWTGYPQNERYTGGKNPALVLWKQVMDEVHQGLEDQDFFDPGGQQSVTYCRDSGLIATQYCAMDPRGNRTEKGSVFPEDVPTQVCNVHTSNNVTRICRDSMMAAGPYCPSDRISYSCPPDFERNQVGGAYAADENVRASHYGGRAVCNVHTGVPEPPEDEDPSGSSSEDGEPGGSSSEPGEPGGSSSEPGTPGSSPEPNPPDTPTQPEDPGTTTPEPGGAENPGTPPVEAPGGSGESGGETPPQPEPPVVDENGMVG